MILKAGHCWSLQVGYVVQEAQVMCTQWPLHDPVTTDNGSKRVKIRQDDDLDTEQTL